jgi:hypothetical protein
MQALIYSDAARRGALEEHRSIKLSTYGIVFMGMPHQGGSGVAFGRLMVNVASVFVAVEDRLQQQLGQYGPISSDFVTKYAFETYATPTVLRQSMVVSQCQTAGLWPLLTVLGRSSSVGCGAIVIHADHINMVKFELKSDTGYRTVSGHLRVMAARAGDAIGQRLDTEGRVHTGT